LQRKGGQGRAAFLQQAGIGFGPGVCVIGDGKFSNGGRGRLLTFSSPQARRAIAFDKKPSVIPTGASRSEAQRRDLFCCLSDKRRSLD
jgi:hypothetical protein